MTAVLAGGRSVVDNLLDRAKAGITTSGSLVILAAESVRYGVTDIIARRFSWTEFLLQCWFMTRVSLLPTILVSIPFGVITSVQIGAAANQIGAQSFIGAVNGIGVLRQGAPLVTSLMIAGAVGIRDLLRPRRPDGPGRDRRPDGHGHLSHPAAASRRACSRRC